MLWPQGFQSDGRLSRSTLAGMDMATKKAKNKQTAARPETKHKAKPVEESAAKKKAAPKSPAKAGHPRTKHQESGAASPYDAIKKDLERQRALLLREVGLSVGEDLGAGEDILSDLGDRASAETDQNFSLRLRERGQNLVKKIEEAMDRIDDGTFGICEVCGGQIAAKRLKARPVTTLCIACKTAQETEERVKQ